MRLIIVLVVGLILTTSVMAVETAAPLKSLKEINKHNMIFDNHSTGSLPYEQYNTTKGKQR